MIAREVINGLSEDELGMLLHITNNLFPCGLEITPAVLSCYNYRILATHLVKSKEKVKDESLPIFQSLCKKLGIDNV